jgi:hypothetical protein
MGASFGYANLDSLESRRVVVATAEVWVASSGCCRLCWPGSEGRGYRT